MTAPDQSGDMLMPPRVLQVNVRLSEGGAAGVAKTVADGIHADGGFVHFAYGYGPHGGGASTRVPYPTTRLTPRLLAGVNLASHAMIGSESPLHSPQHWQRFRKALDSVEVVHLHVVHSYFVNFDSLVRLLASARKPVVWTLHDEWALTGRCAQPGECRSWESRCGSCPDLRAYPPARVDRTHHGWNRRRRSIAKLQDELPTALVACASWLGERATDGGFKNVSIIRNSVDHMFWEQASRPRPRQSDDLFRILFICRDLRDKQKVDWPLLASVGRMPGVQLTIVGDNAPHAVPGAGHLSATNDRREIAKIYQAHDVLLFTSMIDYYPLTIAEALASGLAVVATNSRAAREFGWHDAVQLVSDVGAILEVLGSLRDGCRPRPATVSPERTLAPSRMVGEYIDLYRALVDTT
jgi:putative colanic acid biosynthesis glycosyltransferase